MRAFKIFFFVSVTALLSFSGFAFEQALYPQPLAPAMQDRLQSLLAPR